MGSVSGKNHITGSWDTRARSHSLQWRMYTFRNATRGMLLSHHTNCQPGYVTPCDHVARISHLDLNPIISTSSARLSPHVMHHCCSKSSSSSHSHGPEGKSLRTSWQMIKVPKTSWRQVSSVCGSKAVQSNSERVISIGKVWGSTFAIHFV